MAVLLPVHLNYRAAWHMVIRGTRRYRNSRPRCISGSKRRTNAATQSPSPGSSRLTESSGIQLVSERLSPFPLAAIITGELGWEQPGKAFLLKQVSPRSESDFRLASLPVNILSQPDFNQRLIRHIPLIGLDLYARQQGIRQAQ